MSEAIVRGVAFGALYGLLAAALAIIFSSTRAISLAHGEIAGLAAFLAWSVVEQGGLPWGAGVVVGAVGAAAIGFVFHLLVALPLLGASSSSLTIATSGLLLMLVAIETKIWGSAPHSLRPPWEAAGPNVLGYHLGPAALLGLGMASAVAAGFPLLHRSDLGLALVSIGQDPDATRLAGIRVSRLSAGVWAGSSALAAVAGTLLAPSLGGFAPGSLTLLFVPALAAIVIAGPGRVGAAVAAGVAVGVVEQIAGHLFATSAFPGVEGAAVLALVVLVLVVRRGPALGELRGGA